MKIIKAYIVGGPTNAFDLSRPSDGYLAIYLKKKGADRRLAELNDGRIYPITFTIPYKPKPKHK